MTSLPDQLAPEIGMEALISLGVLLPLQAAPLRFLPGRHSLSRAGDGMRLLRTRPYIPGEDNPRDIDRFSPAERRQVMEWEEEAMASFGVLADLSPSMSTNLKAPLRNACVLQLIYSMWRAGDRVRVHSFGSSNNAPVAAANLQMQLQNTVRMLSNPASDIAMDAATATHRYLHEQRGRPTQLLFVVSDFENPAPKNHDTNVDWRRLANVPGCVLVPVIVSYQIPRFSEGYIRLSDVEHKRVHATWLSRQRIARINKAERRRVAELVRQFRSLGVDSMTVMKQEQIFVQLAQLARTRRRHR